MHDECPLTFFYDYCVFKFVGVSIFVWSSPVQTYMLILISPVYSNNWSICCVVYIFSFKEEWTDVAKSSWQKPEPCFLLWFTVPVQSPEASKRFNQCSKLTWSLYHLNSLTRMCILIACLGLSHLPQFCNSMLLTSQPQRMAGNRNNSNVNVYSFFYKL